MKKHIICLMGFLFTSFMLSLSAYAIEGDFNCPETHPEYSKVLNELESFKDMLKDDLECKEVAVNFDKITDLLSPSNRKELLSIVSATDGKPLTAESAKKIQDFAGSITEEIGLALSLIGTQGGILDFFAETNKCNLEEAQEFQAIERLTKAAYVATNLISKVAGPYGVPLQIGASAFYGVVQGLQSYSKRKRHIDFDQFEKREFFEGAVCLMSKFDADIRKLNNPNAHLRHLKQARTEAQRVVSSLEKINTKITLVLKRKKESQENLEWIEDEIKKYSEIINFKSGESFGIGPRELQSVKNTINKFLLGTAAPEFIDWYAVRAKLSTRDVVKKTQQTLNSVRENLRRDGNKLDLLLPEKLEEKISQNLNVAPYGLRQHYVLQSPEISDLYFIAQNTNQLDKNFYEYYSLLGEAYDLWKLSDLNVRVVQEYCEFFQKTAKYSGAVRRACEERSYVLNSLRTSYQAFYLAKIINETEEISALGPFDFRLEKHIDYIELYSGMRDQPLVLAEAGLDFEEVLAGDATIRFQDGRLRLAKTGENSNAQEKKDWWFELEKNADHFISETETLNQRL